MGSLFASVYMVGYSEPVPSIYILITKKFFVKMNTYTEEVKRAMEGMFDTEYSQVSTPSTTKLTNKQLKERSKNKAAKKARKKQRKWKQY